jgi:hypothetical protein
MDIAATPAGQVRRPAEQRTGASPGDRVVGATGRSAETAADGELPGRVGPGRLPKTGYGRIDGGRRAGGPVASGVGVTEDRRSGVSERSRGPRQTKRAPAWKGPPGTAPGAQNFRPGVA